MKTKTLNTEKNDNTMFAFLPEMVLNHLNEVTPTESTEILNESPAVEKITISAEPDIPNLNSIFENIVEPTIETTDKTENKEEIKSIETFDESLLETPNSETLENKIIQFFKKIKY